MSFTTTRQLRRQAPIAAILLLLLLAFSTVGASAATTVAPYAGSVTAPSGGLWLPGPAGSPGHLWISDSVFGFCRVDVAGLTACNTTAKTPGQPSFDATTGSVYVPDWSATSLGVYRLHFNQATETIDSATLLRPADGLGGNHPTATALEPVTGALYVGFARTPNIVRISNPSLGVGDPKVVMGNSTDNKQTLSLTFLNLAGSVRLVEADSLGLGQIINPAACANRCLASPLSLGIAAPLSVVADASGTALFVGNATSVARFDALAAISAGNPSTYASGFANVSGLAVDPAGVVYAADDATRGLTPGLGHIWSIKQVVVTAPAAPTVVSATAGDALATVSWTAPASDGRSPITSYTVISSPAGGSAVVTAPATSATITGLTNGTAYTFTVVATNAVGSSPASLASNSVTPAAPVPPVIVPPVVTPVPPVVIPVPPVVTPVPPLPVVTAPAVPSAVTATAGDAQATVSWTAPASDGGSPITSYTVISSPAGGSAVVTAPATSATITGLTNGTAYTFTVVATNAVGSSAASLASNSVTPITVPGAPSAVVATAGNASATVSWTAPASDGGSPVTGYTVTSTPGGLTTTVAAPATSATISGLTNGTAYTFTVTAANAAGSGAASLASNSVTPFTVPGAPSAVVATAGNASATVSWSAPAADGGSPVTSYTVTSTPGGLTTTLAAPATSATVSGLTNGTAYTFTVTATNAAGSGAASAASNSVTPFTVPGAPTIGTATAGSSQATVSWVAPANDGGSAITGYTVTSTPGGLSATAAATATSATVAALTPGTAYTFTVTAVNAAGSSAASLASNSVTPFTVPGAPSAVAATAATASATVSWTAPASDGGSPVTGYTVTSAPGGLTTTVAAPATSATLSGLTNGTAYTFTVTAANAAGSGAASAASNSVTPFTVPGAPTIGTATAGNASATVSWTAPASDGGSPITGYTVTSTPGGLTTTVAAPATSATLSGLTNGTAYTFTVTAANAAGSGAASLASNSVTPFTVPGAPSVGTATAGTASATVSWTAPLSDGGSPITGYTVTSAPGGLTATAAATATSATVPGLTPGTAYTFIVTAVNAAGSSAPSLATNSVIPVTVPGAPTAATASAASGQATVTWTPPTSDGFSPITTYTVTSAPGGLIATVSAPATSATIGGLTNGTAYTFTVTAANAAGSGPASTASNSVIPSGPPSPIITQNPPNPSGNPNVTFGFTSTTPGATFTCSLTAAGLADAFTACSSPQSYGPLADGTYTFKLTATDPTTGQASSPDIYVFGVSTKTVPTTTAPVAQPALGAHASISGMPVTISWSGTACTTGAASCNIASYHLQKSVNGLPFFDVALLSPAASSIVESLTPSPVNQATVTTYTYRVQATNAQGQVSAFAIGPTFSVAVTDDSGAVSYTGTWASSALVGAFGGAAHSSTLAGSTASLSTGFSGTGIGLVSSLGPDRGIAEITVDGAVVATVDLYSPTLQTGQVVWSTGSLPTGAHTIKVTVLGTHNPASSGTRVDVDALAAIK